MASPENVLGTTLANTFIGSTDQKIFDTKGRLYQGGKAVFSSDGAIDTYVANYVENVSMTTAGALSPSTFPSYGLTVIGTSGVPTSAAATGTLAAPRIGVEKIIIFKSTAAGQTLDIAVGTGIEIDGTTGSFIGFSTLGTSYQAITLIGLTTSSWGVKSINSTVGGFQAATGIRQLTAVRTT